MRLIGKPLELTLNLIKRMKDDAEASASIEVAMSLVDTIEALQQENEQLKRERQDMFQEILRLSKSEPEYIQSFANSMEKRFELEDKVKQLEAQVTRYRKALEKIASGSWLPHRRIASEAMSDTAMEGQEDFA